MPQRILMIEDDEELSAMVAEFLQPSGFEVARAATARAGLERLADTDFDLLILDVMLPDGDGFDLCRRIRAERALPIVMLTARGDETDRIVGLEIGADDYLPKPFNPRELLARIRAVLRRGSAPAEAANVLRFGRLDIDRDARVVQGVDGKWTPLVKARFTADGNPVVNINAGLMKGQFYLSTGGEIKNDDVPLRDWIERKAGDRKPPEMPFASQDTAK